VTEHGHNWEPDARPHFYAGRTDPGLGSEWGRFVHVHSWRALPHDAGIVLPGEARRASALRHVLTKGGPWGWHGRGRGAGRQKDGAAHQSGRKEDADWFHD